MSHSQARHALIGHYRCPWCPHESPTADQHRQHVRTLHPDEYAKQMTTAGFEQNPDTGEWTPRHT